MRFRRPGKIFFALTLACRIHAATVPNAPVTFAEDANAFTLANEHVVARTDKQNGELRSLCYGGVEMVESRILVFCRT